MKTFEYKVETIEGNALAHEEFLNKLGAYRREVINVHTLYGRYGMNHACIYTLKKHTEINIIRRYR